MLGATISHYQITGRLGSGGMGDVWSARDTLLGRAVAIKVLQASATSPESRQRFLQEARAASALNHPAIVTIYDVVREDENDYIVMELVEGETLGKRIGVRPLEVDDALDLLRAVCAGLAAAHARGIVHRDLKPGNIMIPATGGVKILDFGLAKMSAGAVSVGDDQPTSPRTASGTIFGTLEYMSPEQVTGRPLTAASDIFSLGTIFFEMLTGRRPFEGDSLAATLHHIAYREPPSIETLREDIPEGVRNLLDRMLAKDPEQRYADANELGAAIDALRKGIEPPPLPRPSPTPRRLPMLAAAGGIGVLLAFGWVTLRPPAKRPANTIPPAAATAAAPLPKTAQEHLARGNELLATYWRDGYVDQAIEQFQRALALDPDNAAAHASLSTAYWRRYRETDDAALLNLALQNGRRALELEPQLASAMVATGVAELEQGKTAEAKKHLDAALAIDPANAWAHRALGVMASRGGDAKSAERHYQDAIRADPNNQQLHGDLGVLYYTSGRYDEAAKAFQRSTELAPDNVAGYRNLGAVLHQKGDYAGAARVLQRSLEIRPDPEVYSNLGTLYFFQGLYPQAVTAFEKAVAKGANDAVVWTNLGDAYRWTPGNAAKARDAYTRALQLVDAKIAEDPKNIELLSRRALILAKRGDRDAAIAAADPLAQSKGQEAQTLYRLALAYEFAGARDRAIAQLDHAIDSGYSTEELRKDPELIALRADVRYHRMMINHQ